MNPLNKSLSATTQKQRISLNNSVSNVNLLDLDNMLKLINYKRKSLNGVKKLNMSKAKSVGYREVIAS